MAEELRITIRVNKQKDSEIYKYLDNSRNKTKAAKELMTRALSIPVIPDSHIAYVTQTEHHAKVDDVKEVEREVMIDDVSLKEAAEVTHKHEEIINEDQQEKEDKTPEPIEKEEQVEELESDNKESGEQSNKSIALTQKFLGAFNNR